VVKLGRDVKSQPPSVYELKALAKAAGREVELSTELFNSYVHIAPITDGHAMPEIIIMIPKDCGLDDAMRIAAAAALKELVHVKPVVERAAKRSRKTFVLDDESDDLKSETQEAAADNLKKARK